MFVKHLLFLALLGHFNHTIGKWRGFVNKVALHKNTLLITAATASASIVYAKKDELANKIDDTRIDILKQKKFKILRQAYPNAFHMLVADPLLKKIPYNSLSEYVQESEEDTQRRQTLAKALCEAGVCLRITQTEADILTYAHNKEKKALITNGISFNSIGKNVVPNAADLDSIFKAEKFIYAQGNQVLYHGMSMNIYAHDYICTKLQAITQPDNQHFFNFRPQARQSKSLFAKIWKTQEQTTDFETEGNMRAKILQRPSHNNCNFCSEEPAAQDLGPDHDSVMRKYLISSSPAILSGSRWLSLSERGLESALFFSLFSCMTYGEVLLEKEHDVPAKIMKKYDKRLGQIVSKFFKKCTPSGVMLQISLSPTLMTKAAYPSLPLGYKHTVYKQSPPQKLESTSELFNEIHNNPFNLYIEHTEDNCSGIDPLQLRLIVDKSLLLDPHNPAVREGFKIKAYAINHQDALDEFHREIDEMVAEIRTELNTSRLFRDK